MMIGFAMAPKAQDHEIISQIDDLLDTIKESFEIIREKANQLQVAAREQETRQSERFERR